MTDEIDGAETVERSPNARRNALIVLLVLVVIGALAWAMTRGGGSEQGPGGPGGGRGGRGRIAATVGIAKVTAMDVPQSLSQIGTAQPIVSATVRPQLSGNIFTINFREGQVVAKGQLLAQIDPRPYRLALAQAEIAAVNNEILAHREIGIEIIDLRHYAHAAAGFPRSLRDLEIEHRDLARVGVGEPETQPQRGRLSGAVRAEQPEHAARDGERDVVQRMHAVRVRLREVANLQVHRCTPGEGRRKKRLSW